MKTEDFERLKAICEKEGFTIECNYPLTGNVFIKKNDTWDGVEFALSIRNTKRCKSGIIYKIDEDLYHDIKAIEEHSTAFFQPSTEQAYIEQLKKDAFQRFGEIKEGHRFKFNYTEQKCMIGFEDFEYYKFIDRLQAFGAIIYEKGKWAERVKERVEVEFSEVIFGHEYGVDFISPTLKITGKHNKDHLKMCKFLASQLEKYLNNEI